MPPVWPRLSPPTAVPIKRPGGVHNKRTCLLNEDQSTLTSPDLMTYWHLGFLPPLCITNLKAGCWSQCWWAISWFIRKCKLQYEESRNQQTLLSSCTDRHEEVEQHIYNTLVCLALISAIKRTGQVKGMIIFKCIFF